MYEADQQKFQIKVFVKKHIASDRECKYNSYVFDFLSSAFRSRDIQLLKKKFPCFFVAFCIQETGIIDSGEAWWILLLCHICLYLKQIA